MIRNCFFGCVCGWLAACGAAQHAADTAEPSKWDASETSSDEDREAQLLSTLRANVSLSAEDVRDMHARVRAQTLDYDAREAAGLSKIQASTHTLNDAELARLGEQGFVVSAANEFPTMLYGYASLYVQDLPLFVSADSLLDAVFRAYAAMLEQIELQVLVHDLSELVGGLRARLAGRADSSETAREVDLYLAVAQGLLQDNAAEGVAGADPTEITKWTERARAAQGHERMVLFGSERDVDFSQLAPRGHYASTLALSRYFQTLAWISRTDLRLIETTEQGERVLRRQQLAAALLLRELMDDALLDRYQRISRVLEAFAGRSDALGLRELDSLRAGLGIERWTQLAELSTRDITRVILEGNFGAQRIAGQLTQNRSSVGRPLPLSRVFALFGQRYAVDSHVLSNVVHDVVPERLMPSPLDAAFAAFGNDAALEQLGPELETYAGALESTRQLVDMHAPSYWDEGLNTTWLKALRALSVNASADNALPEVARSAAWDARILNTQLGSWAQLRHATSLYVKPSYTVGLLCEYPDAYVEPYPAFFAALATFGRRGSELAELVFARSERLGTRLRAYFENLESAMSTLGEMAQHELSGKPFTDRQLAFINDAVRKTDDCPGADEFDGWYAKLDFVTEQDGGVRSHVEPIVADIHTQPTDLAGRDVGKILHIGVGLPRLMVVSTRTCEGPRAYAGLVFSYRELISSDWQRLNDAAWADRILGISGEPIADVAWAEAFLVKAP